MSLVKSKTEVVKIPFTEQHIIDLADGIDHIYILRYPSMSIYADWLNAASKSDLGMLDVVARKLITDERGELLLKTENDVVQHDVYEHILVLITEYFLKSKTKNSTPSDQQ